MDVFSEGGLVERFAPLILVLAALASLVASVWKVLWRSGFLIKVARKIAGRETSWKEWEWSIDDDERNQENYTPWQGIPFREIRFFRRHPNWPRPILELSEGMSLLMPPDCDPEDQAYRYEVGTMKHVNGYGGPIGALCYCCYRREGGKNQIMMFFASPGNRDVGKLPLWWRLRIVIFGDGTLEQYTSAQRLLMLILTERIFGRFWTFLVLVLAGLVIG
ncbi:MAG: hypothetical protein OXG60_11670 [Chloroflexi bacterium]|nr:hypothetical protein [Chloroflexota bacterium]